MIISVVRHSFAALKARAEVPLRRGVLIGLVGVGVSGCEDSVAAPKPAAEPPPARVQVDRVTQGGIRIQRRYLGDVRSLAQAELSVGADGMVERVAVREGEQVNKGAILLVADDRLARADLDAARASQDEVTAQRRQAARDAKKFRDASRRLVAEVEIERAEALARQLEARETSLSALSARAKAEVARHRVVAPFSGVVTERHVDPGDWVTAGQIVLELVAERQLEVVVRVDPELVLDLHIGDDVELVRGGERAAGAVTAVVPTVDQATRTATVRIQPEGDPTWLLAGSAVDVVFTIERRPDAVLVPSSALVQGVSTSRVVEVVDDVATPVEVEVVERGLAYTAVRAEGLEEGDVVVVRGNERLTPGQAVTAEVMEAL